MPDRTFNVTVDAMQTALRLGVSSSDISPSGTTERRRAEALLELAESLTKQLAEKDRSTRIAQASAIGAQK